MNDRWKLDAEYTGNGGLPPLIEWNALPIIPNLVLSLILSMGIKREFDNVWSSISRD